ncbi:hypothetical protein P7C70_g3959, partial [Phenoliferia sp. Uapishka_3]
MSSPLVSYVAELINYLTNNALSLKAIDIHISVLAILLSLILKLYNEKPLAPNMLVDKIFIYPIKSLPAIEVDSAKLDAKGFELDRRFVLFSPAVEGAKGELGKDKIHLVSNSPMNTQISIKFTGDASPNSSDASALLPSSTIPTTLSLTSLGGQKYSVPIQPSTAGLSRVTIDMHSSPVDGFDLGEEASSFFTEACGQDRVVRLVYLGDGKREILGTMGAGSTGGIAFNDCASFLLATTSSLSALSSALPQGSAPLSIAPLRPNILLRPESSSSTLTPWAEDFWAALKIGEGVTMRLTSNCVRCVSLNIDYGTGKMKEKGEVLKKGEKRMKLMILSTLRRTLAKDRRVDEGSPYSPVFGRYGFSNDAGQTIRINDLVVVTQKNKERTKFDWPL